MNAQQQDNRIARHLLGYFSEGDYREVVQIEYRYEARGRFELRAQIRDKTYKIAGPKFFNALAELLDQLPKNSAITILHHVRVKHDTVEEIGVLEEWLHPFGEPTGGTVVYQLRLLITDRYFETPQRTSSGYFVVDFRNAIKDLQHRLGNELSLIVCSFCNYLIDYDSFGGTDYRHDQLYCFRDAPEALEEILRVYPRLQGQESLLLQGTADMDALHSCSAFTDKRRPD